MSHQSIDDVFEYNSDVLRYFTIINNTNIKINNSFFRTNLIIDINDILIEICNYKKKTGLLVQDINIDDNINIFILTFDDKIIIINYYDFPKFQKYFDDNCEKKQLHFEEKVFFKKTKIEKIIYRNIIKKCEIRTQNRHYNDKYIIDLDNNDFELDNFQNIKTIQTVSISINIKDQYIYCLKQFDINYKFKEDAFYNKINNQCPFIAKYYGNITKDTIVLEYIKGKTLKNFIEENVNLEYIDKMKIILQIMIAIEFIHLNGFIIRDIKDENIMIDTNKNAILIDFNYSAYENYDIITSNIIGQAKLMSPEVNYYSYYSLKSDIYALGIIIHFILTGKYFGESDINPIFEKMHKSNKNFFDCIKDFKQFDDVELKKIFEIYKKCVDASPENRPSISNLLNDFFDVIQTKAICQEKTDTQLISLIKTLIKIRESQFNILLSNSNIDEQKLNDLYFFFGNEYNNGFFVEFDIEKSIRYLEISSKYDNALALSILGSIYYLNSYLPKHFERSVEYYSHSAELNNSYAQFFLGYMFLYEVKLCKNVNKAIDYLVKSADQNNAEANFMLGYIYLFDDFVKHDINKGLIYFYKSANQGFLHSHYYLGKIYYEGHVVERDIKKSINYLNYSSNIQNSQEYYIYKMMYNCNKNYREYAKGLMNFIEENVSKSQFLLGMIYYDDDSKNNECIEYLTFSSKLNNYDACYELGKIYYFGEKINRDITKSLEYLQIAANGNNSKAQLFLGDLYIQNKNINKGIEYIMKSANNGDSEAQYKIGRLYYYNKDVPRNIDISMFYLNISAQNNNKHAQYLMGEIYYNGKYVKKDIEKSINYLTPAAKQNHIQAQYLLGSIYYGKSTIKESIHFLTLAANQNDSDAQYFLGLIYYNGKKVQRDINKSMHYLRLASNQNYSDAQYLLGKIYHDGKYVPFDLDQSLHYLKLASDQNNSDAQYLLGMIYQNGEHVPIDINKSIFYLKSAAKQNHMLAQRDLGLTYLSNSNNVPIDKNQSIFFLQEAAKKNDEISQMKLGIIYFNENINESIKYFTLSAKQNNKIAEFFLAISLYKRNQKSDDIKNAINYLKYFAEQNDKWAQFFLGEIYYLNQRIPHDIDKAIYYLKCAEKQNDSNARYLLGKIHSDFSLKSFYDIEESINYLKAASKQNNINAQLQLGLIYYKRKYNKYDINKSIFYFKKASDNGNSNAQFLLGEIYYSYRDPNKCLCYMNLSANNNHPDALLILGCFYYLGEFVTQNFYKAINYFEESAKQFNKYAQYYLGEIYYDGKYLKRNIEKAIKYFRESSSMDYLKAKNNLGIIYKNGDGVEKNIGIAMDYFKDGKKLNCLYSIYNLCRIYYFEKNTEKVESDFLHQLEQISNVSFFLGDLFSFYIYSCSYKTELAEHYLYQIINNQSVYESIKIKITTEFINQENNFIFYQRLKQFLQEYDAIYSMNTNYYECFLYFINNGFFRKNNDHINDIDEQFYKGFAE